VFDYLQIILSLFVVTFFIDNIGTYLKHKAVYARKVFTVKKGGLFEHYIIVLVLTLIIMGLHYLGFNPFSIDNVVGLVIQGAMFYITIVLFFMIIAMIFGYVFVYVYVRVKKVENFDTWIQPHIFRSFLIILISSLVFGAMMLFFVFMNLE